MTNIFKEASNFWTLLPLQPADKTSKLGQEINDLIEQKLIKVSLLKNVKICDMLDKTKLQIQALTELLKK